MKTAFFILFFCTTTLLHAQQITNVRFEQKGETVVVQYDITNSENWHLFEITLHLSTDNGKTYSNALRQVSGDVGRDIRGNYSKQITWRAVEEVKTLTGNSIRFKVEALQYAIQSAPEGFVFIQGGTFFMGSNEHTNERPIHSVTVNSFYMSKYEITQKQWRDVMGNNPSSFKNCDNCPVESVSWNDAQNFIKKLNDKTSKNYRLPTEAEWEYAAQSGQNYKDINSNKVGIMAWYNENSYLLGKEHENYGSNPVGQKLPNSYGLYDISGNVWEWCSDWYDENYYQNSPSNNPKGLNNGSYRVLRGGSWYDSAACCRITYRNSLNPNSRGNDIGFRLVYQ